MNRNFSDSLILNKLFLEYLGFESFEDISRQFAKLVNTNNLYEGQSIYFDAFWKKAEVDFKGKISRETMSLYDRNIIAHLKSINASREQEIKLEYFQYFTLLFVECYLDLYFSRKEYLVRELNMKMKEMGLKTLFSEYQEVDLNKLAIWSATGSGKTLIMHINMLQIEHYLDKKSCKIL